MSGLMRSQSGFNLVEVLVAMVILSVGLLGIAGLQLTGVRANQSSYFRSQATAVMIDMVERMHANVTGVRTKQYLGFDTDAGCGNQPTMCGTLKGGAKPSACSAQQIAVYDEYVACNGLPSGIKLKDGLLPGGRILVQCLDKNGNVVTGAACVQGAAYRVTVSWQERTGKNADGTDQVQTASVVSVVQP